MVGIYKITNTINGKVYIGQAQNIEKRWKQHRSASKKEDKVLYRAMRKHGIENFIFEVIEECSIEELNEKEIYYIEQYNSYIYTENSNGYNMTLGGEGNRGLVYTRETKIKMSNSRKGSKNPKAKKVVCEGVVYDSAKQCADYYGLNYGTIRAWLQGKNGITEDFIDKNLHYLDEENKTKISVPQNKGNNPRSRKVVCEGVVYGCIKDCAEHYGVNYATMKTWLSNGSVPQDFAEKNLSYLDGDKPMVKKSRKGANNYTSKRVICEDIIFDCIRQCAEHYGVNYGTMKAWLQGKNNMKPFFKEKGLAYYLE